MKFEKYITRKSINGNSVAKYSAGNAVKLTHEANGKGAVAEITMTENEYDNMIENIEDRFDVLAWILDNKFGCSMLKK